MMMQVKLTARWWRDSIADRARAVTAMTKPMSKRAAADLSTEKNAARPPYDDASEAYRTLVAGFDRRSRARGDGDDEANVKTCRRRFSHRKERGTPSL